MTLEEEVKSRKESTEALQIANERLKAENDYLKGLVEEMNSIKSQLGVIINKEK